jgi:hypothetical protein
MAALASAPTTQTASTDFNLRMSAIVQPYVMTDEQPANNPLQLMRLVNDMHFFDETLLTKRIETQSIDSFCLFVSGFSPEANTYQTVVGELRIPIKPQHKFHGMLPALLFMGSGHTLPPVVGVRVKIGSDSSEVRFWITGSVIKDQTDCLTGFKQWLGESSDSYDWLASNYKKMISLKKKI